MVKLLEGNLLESGADYIAHQVNCQGKMNSGVAKQIRNKWPEVYESYLYFCGLFSGKGAPLGMCDMVPVSTGQVVVNMFAQDRYGYDGKQSAYRSQKIILLLRCAFPGGIGKQLVIEGNGLVLLQQLCVGHIL